MKTQIFKNAWQLVREFGLKLSNALRIAWSEFKISAMWNEYNAGGLFSHELLLLKRNPKQKNKG